MTLQAFKAAEDRRVQLPVMVNMDGFILFHMIEAIQILNQTEANSFLPAMDPVRMLDPAASRSIGAFGAQNVYIEVKKAQDIALHQSSIFWNEVWREFKEIFGRQYRAVDAFAAEDADIIFVTMGAISEAARSAVVEMRGSRE